MPKPSGDPRPGHAAASVPGTTFHLGIDLGGTNLKWSVLANDDDGWRVEEHDQIPTPATAGAAVIVERITELAADAVRRRPDIRSIGIGVPGLYDPATGRTRFIVNIPGDWDGRPIAEPVASAVGLPVALINDARAFGLAELRLGAGRGARSMVGLTLGTGVGGVIVVDGQVLLGHDGTAGELGHQTIDPAGPSCGCGNHGCLEGFVRADRIAAACGAATAEDGFHAARRGDAMAAAGIERIGRYLGIGIANMITVITPDRVVIGGGIAAAADLLLGPIRAELERRVRMTALDAVELVVAELGTKAGSIGAAIHGAEHAAASRDTGAERTPSRSMGGVA